MAESYVQVSTDGTGKKVAANVDADGNYRQVVNVGDGAGVDNFATVTASGALKTDASATTQPVSGTVAVSGNVAVTGTFWQATQPVSGTVAVSGTVPVSGTFWQATQPVSLPAGQAVELLDSGGTNKASISAGGAVKVDGSAVTQPVSGTFWQATQPVSGTFWQATQPISGTVSIAAAQSIELLDSGGTNKAAISAGGALKVDNSAVTQPVSGTFWQATQPVSGTVTANPSVASSLVAPAQTTVAVTNTAVQLANTAYTRGVVVQALTANSTRVVVGGSGVTTGNGFQLAPGQSVTLPINNSNLVYVNGTAGDGVCVIGV